MVLPVRTVKIPEVELTLDQLVAAIRQLEPDARLEITKALMEAEPLRTQRFMYKKSISGYFKTLCSP